MLKKGDKKQQMVYYQSGIGTYTTHQTVTPLASMIAMTVDQMVAWNLDSHVMGPYFFVFSSCGRDLPFFLDGYEFLMQNCEAFPPLKSFER